MRSVFWITLMACISLALLATLYVYHSHSHDTIKSKQPPKTLPPPLHIKTLNIGHDEQLFIIPPHEGFLIMKLQADKTLILMDEAFKNGILQTKAPLSPVKTVTPSNSVNAPEPEPAFLPKKSESSSAPTITRIW